MCLYVNVSPLVSTFCVSGGGGGGGMHCQHSLLECVGGCLHVMLFPSANMPSLLNIIHGPISDSSTVV